MSDDGRWVVTNTRTRTRTSTQANETVLFKRGGNAHMKDRQIEKQLQGGNGEFKNLKIQKWDPKKHGPWNGD